MINPDNWPVDNYTVESVNYEDNGSFSITSTEGWTFGVTPEEAKGKPPVIKGDSIVLLGGFGRPIRGIFINDIQYRYKTREQANKEREDWLSEYHQKQETDFENNIGDWLKRKNALDSPFRERVQRFEDKDFKGFWKESGAYELFVVEQANALFNLACAETVASIDSTETWLNRFSDLDYKLQEKAFPELDNGHSGNTFGGMVGLAKAVARGESI